MVRISLSSALILLASSVSLISGSLHKTWPEIPSFTASAALYPLKLSEIEGTAEPYFSGLMWRYDAASGTLELKVRYKTFAYVSPAYEWLESRTVCSKGHCSTIGRNGTAGCYEDALPNLRTLLLLLGEMPSQGSYVELGNIEDKACDVWRIRNTSVGNLTVCMGSDGVPLSMLAEPSVVSVGQSNVFSYSQNMTLQHILVDADVEAIVPIRCPASPKPEACAGEGVIAQQILRFSDGEPWGELQDRDTCDWTGVGVTGGAPGYWSFMYRKYLEVFDVELDTGFAPWRDCNWDPVQKKEKCLPELPAELGRRVSRMSAEALTANGQCADNALVGSWLVFPHQGRCEAGQAVGDGGCTWQVTDFKVIDIRACLQEAPLTKAWHSDWQKAPFPQVVKYLKEAVEACPNATVANLV